MCVCVYVYVCVYMYVCVHVRYVCACAICVCVCVCVSCTVMPSSGEPSGSNSRTQVACKGACSGHILWQVYTQNLTRG